VTINKPEDFRRESANPPNLHVPSGKVVRAAWASGCFLFSGASGKAVDKYKLLMNLLFRVDGLEISHKRCTCIKRIALYAIKTISKQTREAERTEAA
jgi:hypothetical protein